MPPSSTHYTLRTANTVIALVGLLFSVHSQVLVAQTPQQQALVLHTLKPLQLITQEMFGERVDTQLLIRGVQQAHSYNLRFSDMRQLQSADLLVWMGPEFEHYLSKPLHNLQPRIAAFSWLASQAPNTPHLDDVHSWVDVAVVANGATQLAESLAQLRPENRRQLISQAQQFARRMHQLDEKLATTLRPYQGKGVIVDHRGIEVFLQRYGLRYLGSLQSDNHSSLSLQQARRLRKEVQLANAQCVVLTQGHGAEDLLQIFSGLDISVAEVDIMGDSASNYTMLLERLADAIARCLQ